MVPVVLGGQIGSAKVLGETKETNVAVDGRPTLSARRGDALSCTVLRVDGAEAIVDAGHPQQAVIPLRELAIRRLETAAEAVSVGDVLQAVVVQPHDRQGRLVLSRLRAERQRAAEVLETTFARAGTVAGEVVEVIPGGLILDVGGVRGFLPISFVSPTDGPPAALVGTVLHSKIIQLHSSGTIVVSRRALVEEAEEKEKQVAFEQLKPGELRRGVVVNLVNFGAFVDLGCGVHGLIHISELSWEKVAHPSAVVSIGDELTVTVVQVDRDRKRVSLSLKETQPEPWVTFTNEVRVGDVVSGTVTGLVPFGAFVEVRSCVAGLVHLSELASVPVASPADVVSPGEDVWVKVIGIELDQRRLSLSMKQVLDDDAHRVG